MIKLIYKLLGYQDKENVIQKTKKEIREETQKMTDSISELNTAISNSVAFSIFKATGHKYKKKSKKKIPKIIRPLAYL